VAQNISNDLGTVSGYGVGVRVENILKMRVKPDATERDLLELGIMTDKINSAIRQQIRGYISDLNSVVSVSLVEPDTNKKIFSRDAYANT